MIIRKSAEQVSSTGESRDPVPDAAQTAECSTMRVVCRTSAELDSTELAAWQRLRAGNPELNSPYFSPEFFLAASQVRADTEVAVIYRGDVIVGFFPFHRLADNRGIPIGGAVNDYQGVVAAASWSCDPRWLVRQCGLTRWDFHSLWWPQSQFTPHCFRSNIAASYAWLGAAPQVYLDELFKRSTTISRQAQKTRKMQREWGPLQFTLDEQDPETLQWVISQKREKYRRTGCTDFFAAEWVRRLLERIGQTRQPHFQGLCSVLRAGDRIVAAHFGMRDHDTLHYWYPVFDRQYHAYSPGTELYLQIAATAHQLGIQRIEMGYGQETFKTKVVTHWNHLAAGSVDTSSARFSWNCKWAKITQRLKESSWREPLKHLGRMIIPNLGKPKVE